MQNYMGFDCTLVALELPSGVPVTTASMVKHVCENLIPDELADGYEHVACFITRERKLTLFHDVNPAEMLVDGRGFVVVVRDISSDMMFFLSASTKADAFVYSSYNVTSERITYTIWDRLAGFASFIGDPDGEIIEADATSEDDFLPPTLHDIEPMMIPMNTQKNRMVH